MSALAASEVRVENQDTVIERYELKYVIPSRWIEPITQFIAPYCRLDEHSRVQGDNFYPVNSLYFDTLNYRFLNQRLWGADRRFNMRVRSYGDGREAPYFAELKFKTATYVKKFRAVLELQEWPGFLHTSELDPLDEVETPRRVFKRMAHAYAIEPKIFTCYRRRAFVSEVDDYARVTMDIDMQYRPQTPLICDDPYNLSPDRNCISYDIQSIYGDEAHYQANVILELKATSGFVPTWMIELIRRFELKQVGFSKYVNSSLVDNHDNGWRYMDVSTEGLEPA
ncbi:MAG: VTC domain-containing protein [Pseudomonadales bacterium]|nr:VTC domain-containing protein [Pseudomonadales bacterium]